MERAEIVHHLSEQITALATMHIIYRMDKTQGFSSKKNDISEYIRCH